MFLSLCLNKDNTTFSGSCQQLIDIILHNNREYLVVLAQ